MTERRYAEQADISSARTEFFHGRIKLMLFTERFHFYRRFRMRGIHHIVFYAPPVRADFYAEARARAGVVITA